MLSGGNGNDTLIAVTSDVTGELNGGAGDDVITLGGDGAETRGFIKGDDNANEPGGNDTISVYKFAGEIYGDGGNDIISGTLSHWGTSAIAGGAGDDVIRLQMDETYIQYSGLSIQGGEGSDTITLSGTIGDLYIYGDEGDDVIDARAVISWDAGYQGISLYGGSGSDIILGSSGSDLIWGDSGADTLTGGAGSDTFRGTAADLNGDTITDYQAGERIFLEQNLTSADQLRLVAAANGADSILQIDADNDQNFETECPSSDSLRTLGA